ncbi:MAG: hypothetical protein HY328_01060, partial [Chloroflexi bacterium]|nr:hypothetical protein [Chloroflexota bacterium]
MQSPQTERKTARHEPIGAKKRLLALLLACFYSVVILTLALVVGNLLYEWTRSSIAFTPLVFSNPAEQSSSSELPGALPAGMDAPGAQNSSEQGTSGEEAALMPQRQVSILLLGTDERAHDPAPPR